MNSNTQHTPGPWYVDGDTEIVSEMGDFIATAHLPASYIGTKREYDNAAFIVTACNAHDELVAALREIGALTTVDEPLDFGPALADIQGIVRRVLAGVQP